MEAPYYRIYGDYPAERRVFYPRDECPWLAELERHWRIVRREFEAYRARHAGGLGASFIPDDVPPQRWRSVNFVTYLHWYRRNCAEFPRTLELLRSIPYLTTAFISLLEPRSVLHPHNGDTNTTYRSHLGLAIPGDASACGIEVGGRRRGWREGEAFAFNEAHRHFVWNDTDGDRVVMVVDVMKPEYRPRMLSICGAVLGAITVTMLETRVPALRRLPPRGRRLLHRALGVGAGAVLVGRDGAWRAGARADARPAPAEVRPA